eukprot:TRINITY_DN13942_c0_g1_i1.p2 TRINITY_DN13942_c0_g1~~TRINITY_DN13942_c0_g1_i1.p2  ORF type:complete len:188 (-),score=27.01 TRINITY_DN13942_c0_g1_i1:8-571(-)
MAASLINKTSKIFARMELFDQDYDIPYSEVVRYVNEFVEPPEITLILSKSVKIRVRLENYGSVYVSVVPWDAQTFEKPGTPLPQQVFWGYNEYNEETQSAEIEITEAYSYFYITVSELQAETYYTAFLIAGSAHPGYPDLPSQTDVQEISFSTMPADDIEILNINLAVKLSFQQIGFIFIMTLILAN